nr:DUF5688 family protein [uncultured Sellimonas sp.]
MEYQSFLAEVKESIKKKLYGKVDVQDFHAVKNNGEMRRGFLFQSYNGNISPVIYMEDYFRRYNEGEEIEEIIEELEIFYDHVKKVPDPVMEAEKLSDFREMKNRIVFRLVNRERNTDLLREVPSYSFQDLAVIFYVLFDARKYHAISMLITREHLKKWGIQEEDIWQYAKVNTPRLLPPEIKDIHEMLKEFLTPQEVKKDERFRGNLFVLTNIQRNYGASVVIYPGVLEKISDIWKESFYILPSSVHEMILVPESKSPSAGALKEAVYSINRTDVAKEEWLSDRVYYFQREKKEVFDIDIMKNLC